MVCITGSPNGYNLASGSGRAKGTKKKELGRNGGQRDDGIGETGRSCQEPEGEEAYLTAIDSAIDCTVQHSTLIVLPHVMS